jgi:hypothetical protein
MKEVRKIQPISFMINLRIFENGNSLNFTSQIPALTMLLLLVAGNQKV